MRSTRFMTKSMSCSTSTMVMPSRAQRAQQVGQRLLLQRRRPAAGSSRMTHHRIGGERARDLQEPLLAERQIAGELAEFFAKPDALELAQRLDSAPSAPRRGRGAARRRERRRACADRCRAARCRAASCCGRSLTCWNVRAMPLAAIWRGGRASVTSSPRNTIAPGVRLGSVPVIRLSSVVLPAPFGPIRPSTSPASHLEAHVVDGRQRAEAFGCASIGRRLRRSAAAAVRGSAAERRRRGRAAAAAAGSAGSAAPRRRARSAAAR